MRRLHAQTGSGRLDPFRNGRQRERGRRRDSPAGDGVDGEAEAV